MAKAGAEQRRRKKGTQFVLVPMAKGLGVGELKNALKGTGKLRVQNGRCGKCDENLGIAWCNYVVPGGA